MIGKSLIAQYKQKLSESFVERARGNVAAEDRLLDELDRIWDSMGSDELVQAREFAKNIAEIPLPHEWRPVTATLYLHNGPFDMFIERPVDELGFTQKSASQLWWISATFQETQWRLDCESERLPGYYTSNRRPEKYFSCVV